MYMKKVKGVLLENRVRIFENFESIYSEEYYGKKFEGADGIFLDLSLVEAMHLVEKKKLDVLVNGKKVSKKKLYQKFCDIDKEFPQKYIVYADLRSKGYIVKSGFKFGAHFRVYPKGINPYKEGPKEQKEHTKWIVHAVPEDYELSYQEMSRAVRLAHNIRTKMLWAVVDSENEVTYYEFERVKP